MPPLLYDPPDLRQYTAGLDPPMSAWPGARDNARRPKPKARRMPRPRSGPSAIVTTETGCGAERQARKTPLWGNVQCLGRCGTAAGRTRTRERAPTPTGRSSCTPARMAARNYSGPRLAPNAAYRALAESPQGATDPESALQRPLTLSLGGAGRVVPRPWRLLGPAEGLCDG